MTATQVRLTVHESTLSKIPRIYIGKTFTLTHVGSDKSRDEYVSDCGQFRFMRYDEAVWFVWPIGKIRGYRLYEVTEEA